QPGPRQLGPAARGILSTGPGVRDGGSRRHPQSAARRAGRSDSDARGRSPGGGRLGGRDTLMLCDNCKERDAVINLTQVEHDTKVTLHLCEQCAQQKGVETGASVRGGSQRPPPPAARAQGTAAAGRRERNLRARCRAARPHPSAGMIDLSLLPDGGMGWLDASGPKGSIVLSTRIRLARNLDGYVFSQRAKDADRTAVLTRVEEAGAASDLLQGAVTIRLDQLERVDRQLLHERHLVSKELAGLDREARPRPGAALVVQGTEGVMVNEEDHLRLHGMRSGFAL